MTGPARILVAGGSGFVGATLCAGLRERGHEVVALSRRAGAVPGIRDVPMDLAAADPASISALIDELRPDAVVNAAGAVWDCGEPQMLLLNVELVRRLLAGIAGARRAAPRLVQLGSVHEYGAQPSGAALAESTPAAPATPYGRTKLAATEAVLAADRAGAVPGIVLRVTNVLGPGAPVASLAGRVAAELARAGAAGTRAGLDLSPLQAHRDFVDARDVADAVALCVGSPARGEVVNIGSGRPVAVREVVDLLVRVSGVPAHVRESAPEEATRSFRLDWQQADIGLARRLLGWSPHRSLEDSVRDLWESARARAAGLGRTSTGTQGGPPTLYDEAHHGAGTGPRAARGVESGHAASGGGRR